MLTNLYFYIVALMFYDKINNYSAVLKMYVKAFAYKGVI